jgi:hypothetical protein
VDGVRQMLSKASVFGVAATAHGIVVRARLSIENPRGADSFSCYLKGPGPKWMADLLVVLNADNRHQG